MACANSSPARSSAACRAARAERAYGRPATRSRDGGRRAAFRGVGRSRGTVGRSRAATEHQRHPRPEPAASAAAASDLGPEPRAGLGRRPSAPAAWTDEQPGTCPDPRGWVVLGRFGRGGRLQRSIKGAFSPRYRSVYRRLSVPSRSRLRVSGRRRSGSRDPQPAPSATRARACPCPARSRWRRRGC